MATDKEEFPPLLGEGLHPKTLAELRAHCVAQPRFKDSPTRDDIMGRLESAVQRLIDAGIAGVVWVDGSFLTEKYQPNDVDLVVRIDSAFYDVATLEQLNVLQWITEIWDTEKIDGYLIIEWLPGHPNYQLGQDGYTYWRKWLGTSRSGVPKGIAVVELSVVNP
jgi:hypothetical protein